MKTRIAIPKKYAKKSMEGSENGVPRKKKRWFISSRRSSIEVASSAMFCHVGFDAAAALAGGMAIARICETQKEYEDLVVLGVDGGCKQRRKMRRALPPTLEQRIADSLELPPAVNSLSK